MELMLASRNAHKLEEFRRLLVPHVVVALPDEVVLPPEDGDSFEANARVKAEAAAEQTGRAALADDSGISAAALDGAPGIYSARFAGEDATDQANLDKLLRDVPADGDRRVSYICALAWAEPGKETRVFTRRCDGVAGARAARRRRLRLRPGVPARGHGRRPHDGRAQRRREGRDQPPRPRRAGVRRVARRRTARHEPDRRVDVAQDPLRRRAPPGRQDPRRAASRSSRTSC